MMAKIVKGQTFSGCVRYVLDKEKAELLETTGLQLGDSSQIASDFELQAMLNPKVKNTVGHISLNFALQDERLAGDDSLMLTIAKEHLERMDIRNTQYLIARHTDRNHSHCHIIYNRVDCDGKTISDKNDRFRSEKICKMLTAKHRLHFAQGKEQVNENRLRHKDAKKYHIYNAIKATLPICRSWESFQNRLDAQGVKMEFKYKSGSDERQGVKFEYDGVSFSGSKIDRAYSFMHLDNHFANQNHHRVERHVSQAAAQTEHSVASEVAGGLLSILSSPLEVNGNYEDQAEFERLERLKKKKRRGLRM